MTADFLMGIGEGAMREAQKLKGEPGAKRRPKPKSTDPDSPPAPSGEEPAPPGDGSSASGLSSPGAGPPTSSPTTTKTEVLRVISKYREAGYDFANWPVPDNPTADQLRAWIDTIDAAHAAAKGKLEELQDRLAKAMSKQAAGDADTTIH
jgi:hypothetical protein